MSEDKQSIDADEIASTKGTLEHVETEEKRSSIKPVFKCAECGATEEIPEDILAKMENDEDISASIPDHEGHGQMKISVTE